MSNIEKVLVTEKNHEKIFPKQTQESDSEQLRFTRDNIWSTNMVSINERTRKMGNVERERENKNT